MRSVHDLGGLSAGAVPIEDHDRPAYAKRADAVNVLLRRPGRGLLSLDQLRRNNEALGDMYHELSYDDRLVHAQTQTLIQRGVITVEELGRAMEALRDAG